VVPRPEGQRCLLVAADGQTVARDKRGRVLARFQSALPGGARGTRSGHFSVLDCVLHVPDSTYYALDLLCWKGVAHFDSGAAFRAFWLESRLLEVPALAQRSPGANDHRVVALPARLCDLAALRQAYEAPLPFVRDGLLFSASEGHYARGETPLVLQWKDARCSRYAVDGVGPGAAPDQPLPAQTCTLRAAAGGRLEALAGDVVAKLAQADLDAHGIAPGDLCRFAVHGAVVLAAQHQHDQRQPLGMDTDEPEHPPELERGLEREHDRANGHDETSAARIRVQGLVFLGKLSSYMRSPDASSKIAFQYALRHGPLSIDAIAARVAQNQAL
jgi:hypothetical protein